MPRVGVLAKIAALLDVLSVAATPPSVAELSRMLGMPRATVHRLIRALAEEGLLDARHGRFYPGMRLVQWASAAWERSDLRRVAHPVLLRLAKETGETAAIFIRVGHQRVCLDRVEGPGILRATIPIGSANPLHLGSAGKILLAFSPASSWEELWHASRRQFPSGLEAAFPDLAAIRRQGYAISAGDRDDALASLSVPVLGTEGEAVAALSISGPISRLTEAKLQRYVPLLQRAAIEVGQELRVQLGVREDERAR